MDSTIPEQIVQYKLAALLPTINNLTIEEVKCCIFENRKQELQRHNLRNAWQCEKSLDPSLSIEQEFSLHKDSTIDANLSIEALRAIFIGELKASLKKQIEIEWWMVMGGDVP